MRCGKCAKDNREGRRFCSECGAALAIKCAQCEAANEPGEKFCGECGAALATAPLPPARETQVAQATALGPQEPGGQPPEGERKTVTALFADIKGSMELMEDLDPEEARAIIDPALKLMIDAAHRYDGYIVQSTGDGIFALFGAPVAHEDHPQRALYAALRMQEDLRRYADKLRQEGKTPVQVRVGVNTGEVVVRSIQTASGHAEYTPIGHSTGLAARLQALANPGAVLIGESLRRLAEGYFQLKPLGPARIKGVNEPVELFEVTGLGPLRTRLQRAARRGLTRYVGRRAEIEAIQKAAELAKAGHGQIVAAMAEAGVGKSRLFYEFELASRAGWMVLDAHSVSHGNASAYLPVINLLKNYFHIALEDDERARREKVNGRVLTLDRSLEDTLPYLLSLFGLSQGEDPLAQMDPQVRTRRTLDAIKRILLRESLNQPVMAIFEDLHWIDTETQALLNVLIEGIATSRILMLVNYRPEYTHGWGNKTYYTQLRLDPLGQENAEEMLDALLGSGTPLRGQAGSGLPLLDRGERRSVGIAPLKRLIIERTEGNPFFIEEIVQNLFEEGTLVRNGEVQLARPLDAIRIPPLVQAILAARIDRLSPDEKDLLQMLSVAGREFRLGLIRQVSAAPPDELERVLRNLQLGEFIYEQPAFPDPEYSFKHALTQEVAYNSVLTERRRLLHGRIGAALEQLHANRLEDHLPELAHHFTRSANTAKAVEYLFKAGQSAAQRSASREALDRFEAALTLLKSLHAGPARDQQELAIRVAMWLPMLEARGFASADIEVNLQRALELCDKAETPANVLFQVLNGLRSFYMFSAKFAMARSLAARIIALGKDHNDEFACVSGYVWLGALDVFTGEYRAALTPLLQASAICERLLPACPRPMLRAITNPLINSLLYLSLSAWILGHPEQALGYLGRLLAVPEQLRAKWDTGIMIDAEFEIRCGLLRDYRRARENAEAMTVLAKENGFSLWAALGSFMLGYVAVHEGDVEEGIKAILDGREMMTAGDNILFYQILNRSVADAGLAAGRHGEGLAAVDQAIAAANQFNLRRDEAELHRLRGELLLLAGAPESEAEESMRRAIALAQRQEAKGWELRAATSLARLLRKQGRIGQARDVLAPVYNWFTEGFDTADLKDAKALLDELVG